MPICLTAVTWAPLGVNKRAKFGKVPLLHLWAVKYALTQILSQPRIVRIPSCFFHLSSLWNEQRKTDKHQQQQVVWQTKEDFKNCNFCAPTESEFKSLMKTYLTPVLVGFSRSIYKISSFTWILAELTQPWKIFYKGGASRLNRN